MHLFKHRTGSTAVIFSALAMISSGPALADEIATSTQDRATIQPLPSSPSYAPLGQGDNSFRQLFTDWEKIDQAQNGLTNPVAKVAVPSRMPLDKARTTSNYGMRSHPVLGGRRQHHGIDLASPTGTPVYATADGRVDKAQRFSSYGLYIRIDHGGELETRYAHLSALSVSEGQMVRKGDLIGHVGSTGRSTGPHLHYEVRVSGQSVNPIPYMVETSAQRAFALAHSESRLPGTE